LLHDDRFHHDDRDHSSTMSTTLASLDVLRERFAAARAKKLDLDMTRGKPCAEQLDLSLPLLDCLRPGDYRAIDGTDCRNYGLVDGLPEAKRFFADILEVAPDDVIVGDNASLSLMYDVISEAMHRGVPGSVRPWGREPRVRVLCPSPGYDRHFALCEFLGAETVAVGLGDQGPDLDEVARLAAGDPAVKAIFCVPRYSNPTGITYAAEAVRHLARMKTAAPDFRIVWDNAYAVHHLDATPEPLHDLMAECRAAGHPDRPLLFTSTSKITFAGAGISAIAGSAANLEWFRSTRIKRTIGPDKITQLRHLRFLPDRAALDAHMRRHAAILRPKFEAVAEVLERELGGLGVASWSRPKGGYFISLDVPDGCAAKVVARAREAGVKLTAAGATFPRGKDPRDRNIRVAPSFPPLAELRQATEILALAVQLVVAEDGAGVAENGAGVAENGAGVAANGAAAHAARS
jgi:DNA-binding transcriptional MocR family regulator